MRTARIPVLQVHLRRFGDPTDPEARFSFFLLARVVDLPPDIPLDVNPRKQNIYSRVARHIRDGLMNSPSDFHLLNRGITILAHEAFYDSRKSCLVLRFPQNDHAHDDSPSYAEGAEDPDPDRYDLETYVRGNDYGIVDGGHTYAVILDALKSVSEKGEIEKADEFNNAFVRLEVLVGVDSELAVDVARARNTSAQVKEQALADLSGQFDWIRNCLRGQAYPNLVAYTENENQKDDPHPIDIRDILRILTAFHPDYFSGDAHPIMAYRGAGNCLSKYVSEVKSRARSAQDDGQGPFRVPDGYGKLEPVLTDLIELYWQIKAEFATIYNQVGISSVRRRKAGQMEDQDASASGGKAGKYQHFKDKSPSEYLGGREPRYIPPESFVIPLLSAFRANLDYSGASLCWKHDPQELFRENGKKYVEIVLNSAEELKKANSVGKSSNLWKQLYNQVLVDVLQKGVAVA